jgi:nucleotide-binding universal stress UspA family protein
MNALLIPTDFSPVADNALSYALEMANYYKLDITLLHVVLLSTPSVANVVYVDMTTDFQKQAEEEMLKKVAGLKEKYPALTIQHKVETGLFLDSLQRFAEESKPVAIVMGITGDGTGFDKIIGSNTVLAMNHITFPLIVVPKNASFKPVNTICFACDLKQVANSTPLLSIKAFAKLFNSQVHILNIDWHNRHFNADTPNEIEVLNLMFESIETKFHFIEHESMQDAINDFIDSSHMDMLIMLPKKHSWFESLFKKSSTKEMLYHSHIPILALHHM